MTGMHPEIELDEAFEIARNALGLQSKNIPELVEASKTVKYKTVRNLRHKIATLPRNIHYEIREFEAISSVFDEMMKDIPDETYDRFAPRLLETGLDRARFSPEEKMERREKEVVAQWEKQKTKTAEDTGTPSGKFYKKGLRKQTAHMEQVFGAPQGGLEAEKKRPPLSISTRRNELAIAAIIIKHARASSRPPMMEPLVNLIVLADAEKGRYKASYQEEGKLNRDIRALRTEALNLLNMIGQRWPEVITDEVREKMVAVRDQEAKFMQNPKQRVLGIEIEKILAIPACVKSLPIETVPAATTKNAPKPYKGIKGISVRLCRCNADQRAAWAQLAAQSRASQNRGGSKPREDFKNAMKQTYLKTQRNNPRRILESKFRTNDPALVQG